MAYHQSHGFSTLEVVQGEWAASRTPGRQAGLEVVPTEWPQAHEPTQGYKPSDLNVVEDTPLPEALPNQLQYKDGLPQHWHDKPLPASEPRILGLKKRTFWIVLGVGLVVVLGAVLGGVLGTVLSRHSASSVNGSGNGSSNSSSSTGSPSNSTARVLANSQLAAINWTDTSGNAYRAIFYQDSASDLVFSFWDSVNKTWSPSRLVDLVPQSSKGSIQPQNATALAAVVRAYPWTASPWNYDFGISLFYLDQKNNIQELSSTDPRGAVWAVGDLSNSSRTYAANGAAQLAAWYSLCTSECDGNIWLFYQDSGQRLQFANSSDWAQPPYQLVGSGVESGTGLGVAAVQNDGDGVGPVNGAAVYYASGNEMVEVFWDNFAWHSVGGPETPLPFPPPQTAVLGFANNTDELNAVNNFLVVTLDSHGTLLTNHWNTLAWATNDEPSIQGTSQDVFEAIALVAAEDLLFYGLTSGGAIKEFTIDRSSPLNWTFDSFVVASS